MDIDPSKPRPTTPEEDAAKESYLRSIRASQIDPNGSEHYGRFVEFIDSTKHLRQHYIRYCRTFRSIDDHFGSLEGADIIETGGPSPLLNFIAKANRCAVSRSDLRTSIDAETASADFVFSFEVLEHIKDAPEKEFREITLFQGSGARNYATEIVRVLRPGGHLVLTTPNPAAYKAFKNLVDGDAPCIFRPHVREYTKAEVVELFGALDLVHHETQFNFFYLSEVVQQANHKLFAASGWSTDNRGDDHVFIFRKAAD